MKLTENTVLKEHIMARIVEFGWKDQNLIADAESRGFIIDRYRWSKYKNGKKGSITDDTLLWVATRLGIDISVRLGKPVIKDGKTTWEVPPYDENKALERLNILFPKENGNI